MTKSLLLNYRMIRGSEIPVSEFSEIIAEMERSPLPMNNYRNVSGSGRSQVFGIVNRRCLPPDYSRLCWGRPYLYKLLLDFASKHVKIPFTSITLNQNYKAAPHRDKGNVGVSFLVGFGDYEGGELQMLEGDCSGSYNVNRIPMTADFSATLHAVNDYTGNRYSLVFYTCKRAENLPLPSVVYQNGKYLFKRGDDIIKTGLAHPLKGRKRAMTFVREDKEVVMEFP